MSSSWSIALRAATETRITSATMARRTRRAAVGLSWLFVFVCFVSSWRESGLHAADNARQVVEESQKRTTAQSQRYEGMLQVFDAKGKVSDKRWTLERLGSHGTSKMVLRFTQPAEVKGVALLVVNHPDRASDQWKIGRAHV